MKSYSIYLGNRGIVFVLRLENSTNTKLLHSSTDSKNEFQVWEEMLLNPGKIFVFQDDEIKDMLNFIQNLPVVFYDTNINVIKKWHKELNLFLKKISEMG
jgi:hypothetical protein